MSKASQLRIHRLEEKLAHEEALLDSLKKNQSALYEQLSFTSNAADRNNLERQIEALDPKIEAALARYEAAEHQLAELKGSNAPSPPAQSDRTATPSTPPTKLTFEFEVVTVNAEGQEEERKRGRAEYFSEDLGHGVRLEMVSIPGGHFVMGSPEKELGYLEKEGPQHLVTVSAFFMGRYPVTQVQWKMVADLPKVEHKLEPNPSHFKGIDRPVERVSWLDAVEFCARLSQATGREYRLPSEAEWEYACRAGTTTPFHFGETITTELANYRGTDPGVYGWSGSYGDGPKGDYCEETTPVGSFKVPNAFGLFDMHGNVWEWCADYWHGNYEGAPTDGSAWFGDVNDDYYRIMRGGSWHLLPMDCRSAVRNRYFFDGLDGSINDIGFRVVCVAPRV